MANKIPVSKIMDVLTAGREADKGLAETVRVLILIDPNARREMVELVRDTFMAERMGGIVNVRMLDGSPVVTQDDPDVCVIICGGGDALVAQAAQALVNRGVPVAALAEAAVDAPALPHTEVTDKLYSIVASSDEADLLDKLAKWLVGATEKGRAFAANFPFCRRAEVDALVRACALENAAVGAINLVPGSDLPIMTVNQARLALDIAAAYGHGLELSRVPEMAGVAGAGFAYRAIARSVVGLIPGVGWLLRAGMGYAGTVSTAKAIQARFEAEDGTLESLPLELLKRLRGKSSESADAEQPASAEIPASPSALAIVPRVARRRASAEAGRTAEAPRAEAQPKKDDSGYLTIDENGLVGEDGA